MTTYNVGDRLKIDSEATVLRAYGTTTILVFEGGGEQDAVAFFNHTLDRVATKIIPPIPEVRGTLIGSELSTSPQFIFDGEFWRTLDGRLAWSRGDHPRSDIYKVYYTPEAK